MESIAPISVVIPTFKRIEKLQQTLKQIYSCNPQPQEIIVVIDNNDKETFDMLSENFSYVKKILNENINGPGGCRNIGVSAATNEWVASFDDDSYPYDQTYFSTLSELISENRDATLIEATIFDRNQPVIERSATLKNIYNFTGCGVAYNKNKFIQYGGYVPIQPAYGMEETDFALRSFSAGAIFLKSRLLRVFHDSLLSHHASKEINAAAISNTFLLCFLRYPVLLWPYGMVQTMNRFVWCIKESRFAGLLTGIFRIIPLCYRYRRYRSLVPARQVWLLRKKIRAEMVATAAESKQLVSSSMEIIKDKILIAIISKNRAYILPKAIDSALQQEYDDKEVSVFDDSSTDNTAELKTKYNNVSWHFSTGNKGYLFARNMLLQTTDAEYYCSLDDDSWFLNDKLQKAVDFMDASPNIAVLAFKILSNDLTREIKRGNNIVETNTFIGCGHMLRVSAVKSVGCYAVNPGYYGGEEKDLCIRLIDKGFSIYRFPEVEVWHDKANKPSDIPFQYRSSVCNDLVFMWRRTPFAYLIPSLFIKLYKHISYSVKNKEANLLKYCLKGIGDFFVALFKGKIDRNAVSKKAFKKYLSFNQ